MYKFLGVCLLAVVLCGLPSLTQADGGMTEEQCNKLTSCGDCISGGTDKAVDLSCYWCATNKCGHFDFSAALPVKGIDCPQLKYNVGICKLTALVIIIVITLGCLLFVVLIVTVCCICCCWCNRRRRRVQMIEEAQYIEERDAVRQRSAERRAERKAKHDEIRRKYDLRHDDYPSSYKRLE